MPGPLLQGRDRTLYFPNKTSVGNKPYQCFYVNAPIVERVLIASLILDFMIGYTKVRNPTNAAIVTKAFLIGSHWQGLINHERPRPVKNPINVFIVVNVLLKFMPYHVIRGPTPVRNLINALIVVSVLLKKCLIMS